MRTLINGAAGRIGRLVTHNYFTSQGFEPGSELVAINDPAGLEKTVQSLTSNDPVHGRFNWMVGPSDTGKIGIEDEIVDFYDKKDLTELHLKDLGIECVIDCSGRYGDPKTKDGTLRLEDNVARQLLNHGVKKVILTYPSKTADTMMIMGVNHQGYNPESHNVISNASCTTKALAMPLRVLLDNGIEIHGLSMNSPHAATSSQHVFECLGEMRTHPTGAAQALAYVIPELKGKMNGMAYRGPILDGSFAHMCAVVSSVNTLTTDKINNIIHRGSGQDKYSGRLGIIDQETVSTNDIVGRRENSLFIPSQTKLLSLDDLAPEGKNTYILTMVAGYDNELGSSVDPVLLAEYVSDKARD